MSDEFSIYYRNLPHWRQQGAVYFTTWRLHKSQAPLSPSERTIVTNAINFFNRQRYQLFIYVVMDDHVHVVVQPFADYKLEQILHSWKSFTTNQMHKTGKRERSVWQADFHDHIIRHDEELVDTMHYIAGNPIRRWPEMQDYEWLRFEWD